MQPTITTIVEKKLVGKKLVMSLDNNKTFELWKSFMPRRKEIKNIIGTNLYSVEIYLPNYFDEFNPAQEFEKWAAMEVTAVQEISDEMHSLTIPAGEYAVFHYKGLNTDTGIFRYIYGEWLPNSKYSLDLRPHFAEMGEKYRNNDRESEEDIYIPIRPK